MRRKIDHSGHNIRPGDIVTIDPTLHPNARWPERPYKVLRLVEWSEHPTPCAVVCPLDKRYHSTYAVQFLIKEKHMRHQTITVAIPDDLQWRKGDHLHPTGHFLIVDAEEPVEAPKRIGIDFTLSFDSLPGVAPGETLADDLGDWIVRAVKLAGSPMSWPMTRNVEIQILGQATYTP